MVSGDGYRSEVNDEEKIAEYGRMLAVAIEHALPRWISDSVDSRRSGDRPPGLTEKIDDSGRRAIGEIGIQIRNLLSVDIDEQWTTPLSLLRGAVAYPTSILQELAVSPSIRDADTVRRFPEDIYDLTPSSLADFGPSAHEAGIRWGAAKAHIHLQRHAR